MQPFKIQISAQEVDYLKQRLANARWTTPAIQNGWEKGVPVDYLKQAADYWQHRFDWKQQEAHLNQYPHFITEIEGQNIHYLHIRSARANAVPLMLIHGWPGSFADFTRIIEPLTNPEDPEQIAFDLVIPSIPGFGFSVPVKVQGYNMFKIATTFATLMNRLGYEKFAVHGGDMGAGIAGIMSGVAAYNLIGTHINSDFFAVAGLGMFPADDSSFTDAEKAVLERMKRYKKEGTAYLEIQATRPDTIGIALSDSPVGQLAWMVEKYKEWTDHDKDLPEDAIGMDLMLTNVSLYWFNQLGASSAAILSENMSMAFDWGGTQEASQWAPPKVPSAMACFGKKEEESLLKKLTSFMGEPDRWSFYESGCHFPAMEVPDLLVEDIRQFFAAILRSSI
ncbi:pimeloyl-ACP methyl ester carboxylesterase [Dyadobacter sp. BE34]|uniref:Pimeloyl-ACP methyl ester carboxylesterase n=1 Tax=Dyadobacter fermentans TaxID=94254 RepID=A0ABU1QUN6_9BACT|nr:MULTISPECIES: epoxide hydrolase [Dyadobacter]MDR6804866.1 pimeloyl-ACP methyl ester carboxylesterase [Dyadobacter fermentans]MDR7043375.1 pimeloyl-ACP methyl ester carboxylesterase [Dyadobacter sp. BE242]MDR7197687.1 pimeloyl-ACP methyl ester carboxylesterase [Dyadobacter sp. BE34]MDR7214880.1 pimeloyl-ACP methyl ester carboxylesterase [Dyadobacter sp. BE31]MDR7262415.1 pimeloyl-ACP methyl ester carboxylesterase [Dyadobacter sp. BE32]